MEELAPSVVRVRGDVRVEVGEGSSSSVVVVLRVAEGLVRRVVVVRDRVRFGSVVVGVGL